MLVKTIIDYHQLSRPFERALILHFERSRHRKLSPTRRSIKMFAFPDQGVKRLHTSSSDTVTFLGIANLCLSWQVSPTTDLHLCSLPMRQSRCPVFSWSLPFRLWCCFPFDFSSAVICPWCVSCFLKIKIYSCLHYLGVICAIRELKQRRRQRRRRRQVKNEFIFYQRNLWFFRSVRFANGSKIVLKLNMQRRRSLPNGNTKN